VATVVVGKWYRQLDETRMQRTLDGENDAEAEDPEALLVEEEEGGKPIPAALHQSRNT